jgi:hypothetical protein
MRLVLNDVILNCNRLPNKNENISIMFFDLSTINVVKKENLT